MVLTLYWACEPDITKDFEFRSIQEFPEIGKMVWMDPETQNPEWETTKVHWFQSSISGIEVAIAEVARTPDAKANLHEAYHLYLLDGQYYNLGIAGNGDDLAPELGPFVEYGYGCKVLPLTKTVTHCEELKGDGACLVYVAHMTPILVPNAFVA